MCAPTGTYVCICMYVQGMCTHRSACMSICVCTKDVHVCTCIREVHVCAQECMHTHVCARGVHMCVCTGVCA